MLRAYRHRAVFWLLQGFFRAPWVARDFGISVEDVRSPPTHGNSGLQELRG